MAISEIPEVDSGNNKNPEDLEALSNATAPAQEESQGRTAPDQDPLPLAEEDAGPLPDPNGNPGGPDQEFSTPDPLGLPDVEEPQQGDQPMPDFAPENDPQPRGPQEGQPVKQDWGDLPEDYAPHDVHPPIELPDPPELPPHEPVGNIEEKETPSPFQLPWMYPIPPQGPEDERIPQYQEPEEEDVGNPYQPDEATKTRGEGLDFSTPGAPTSPPVTGPAYEAPPPVPTEMTQNEDLFARVGWPVAPPRVAQTFWYS